MKKYIKVISDLTITNKMINWSEHFQRYHIVSNVNYHKKCVSLPATAYGSEKQQGLASAWPKASTVVNSSGGFGLGLGSGYSSMDAKEKLAVNKVKCWAFANVTPVK